MCGCVCVSGGGASEEGQWWTGTSPARAFKRGIDMGVVCREILLSLHGGTLLMGPCQGCVFKPFHAVWPHAVDTKYHFF